MFKTLWTKILGEHIEFKCVGCNRCCRTIGYKYNFTNYEDCDGTENGFVSILKKLHEEIK